MKFRRLEAVRGFAAFYVCLSHVVLAQPLSSTVLLLPMKFGQEAVIVFFVLSGFVVSWATIKPNSPPERFKTYFLKRFTRIYSVWAASLVAMFFMKWAAVGKPTWETPGRFLGNALMLQDFAAGKPAVVCSAIYGDVPLWSLHYEWWFYMLFPAILLVRDATLRSHIVGVLCIFGSITYTVIPNPASRLVMYFGVWWIGVHAATVLRARGRIQFKDVIVPLAYVAGAIMPLAILCAAWIASGKAWAIGIHPLLETRHLVSAIALVCAAFAWRNISWLGFNKTIDRFTFLAPISYSLYILHYNGIAHAEYLSFLENSPLEILLYLVITLALCVFSEVYAYPSFRKIMIPTPSPVKG